MNEENESIGGYVIMSWPIGWFSERQIGIETNDEGFFVDVVLGKSLEEIKFISDEVGRQEGFCKGIFKLVQVK